MEDFCRYCGRMLNEGETCDCSPERQYNTYSQPEEPYKSPYEDTSHNDNFSYRSSAYNSDFYTTHGQMSPAQYELDRKKRSVRNLSIIALVIGIESLVSCWSGISIVSGIAALIISITAMNKNKEFKSKLPVVALVISILGVVLSSIFVLLFFVLSIYS